MPTVFIGYRREDTKTEAVRIYDRLAGVYGASRVFMDVATIRPSANFEEAITGFIRTCDVMVALIGQYWARDISGKRLFDDSNDYVLLELSTALRFGVRVLPVLIGDATMPSADELAKTVKEVVTTHAMRLRPEPVNFNADIEALRRAVELGNELSTDSAGYIPQQSTNFILWLDNFETKCRQYRGQYEIDDQFLTNVAAARTRLSAAENEVEKANASALSAQRLQDLAEKALTEAKNGLILAQSQFRKAQDDRTQATYDAVNRVTPLAEKVRRDGRMYDNLRREMGIFGQSFQQLANVSKPSNLQVSTNKPSLFNRSQRRDVLIWDANVNPADTQYEVFASHGAWSRGNSASPDPINSKKISETSATKYDYAVPGPAEMAIMYKVRAVRNGLSSEFSDPVITRR